MTVRRSWSVRHPLTPIVALLGVAYLGATAFGYWAPGSEHPFIGGHLYDVYARVLLDGRLDLPVRELHIEGHYTPDGRGYMYHGLGPLITRLPFVPFVDLPTTWLAPLSIWFWAVVGNLCWHRAFLLAVDKASVALGGAGGAFRTILALAMWFGSPGILLVANGSVYYEPIAMAYGLSGGFALLIAMATFGAIGLERALPWLAVLAGFMVHARPHVAIGLYAGVCMIALVSVRLGGRRNWSRAGAAMLILALFGGLLLAFNAARFNGLSVMHGTFAKSELQYGMAFWGFEDPTRGRARAFEEHGRINAGRIPPNLLFYAAAPPSTAATEPVLAVFEGFNAFFPAAAFIRVEEPRAGVILLWPFFVLLMGFGVRRRSLWQMPALAGTAAFSIAALLMLSYATITLRYHVDIWPAVAFPALFGIGPVAALMAADFPRGWAIKLAVPVLLVGGILFGTAIAIGSRARLIEEPGGSARRWSFDYCARRAMLRGFSPDRSRQICLPIFDVK